MARRSSKSDLDELDLMLIRELETDARKSYAELGEVLGRSEAAVHRRLRRLLAEGTITIPAIINPLAVGYCAWAFLGITVVPGALDAVVNHLIPYRSVKYLDLTTGRYDLFAWVFFHSSEDLLAFFGDAFGSVDGVHDVEMMTILQNPKFSWALMGSSDFSVDFGKKPLQLDATDLRLLRELEEDGRQPVTRIASKLNMSSPVVGRRLQVLFDEGIVRPVCLARRSALGYMVRTALLLRVNPGRINEVTDQLASLAMVKALYVTSGSFNLMAMAVFRDAEELSDFLRNRVSRISGISRCETQVSLDHMKFTFSVASEMVQ